MIVEVIKAGLYTTLQDGGRISCAHLGIPSGGAMDMDSYELCNMILGNDSNEPAIECTMLGPVLSFDRPTTIAITGSDLSPMINKNLIALHRSFSVNSGDQLSFGRLNNGCRCYIGIAGSWQIERWQGSVSPLSYGEVLSQHILKKGSKLEITPTTTMDQQQPTIELNKKVSIGSPHIIEIFVGPEMYLFKADDLKTFLSTLYKVSNAANRMGYKLVGEPLNMDGIPPMISSGIIPGTVQMTSSGTPIILCRDAQTIGGYPRIGVLSASSLNQMAHIKPGDQIKFKLIS